MFLCWFFGLVVFLKINYNKIYCILTVTDGEVEECVDPGGNVAILNVGEGGGTRLPRGEGNKQLASDSG